MPPFKAKVALEALKEQKILAQLSSEYLLRNLVVDRLRKMKQFGATCFAVSLLWY
jgi:hypothetical protein